MTSFPLPFAQPFLFYVLSTAHIPSCSPHTPPLYNSWKIDPFPAPSSKTPSAPFLDESSFALLFPKYREPYLRSIWSSITSSLERVGLTCELDLVQGKMTVKTTRKTWDPYIVFKGRDLLKLLARGVGAPQASRVFHSSWGYHVRTSNIKRSLMIRVSALRTYCGTRGQSVKGLH